MASDVDCPRTCNWAPRSIMTKSRERMSGNVCRRAYVDIVAAVRAVVGSALQHVARLAYERVEGLDEA